MNGKESLELSDYINVVWKRKLLIVLFTFIIMVIAAVFNLMTPNVYQATATLVLLPPKFQTELAPSILSIHTYMNLLKAPELLKAIIDTLEIEDATVEGLNRNLETEIVEEKYGAQKISYSPLIKLLVRADTPQRAADIANAWAEIFVEKNKNLSTKGKESSLKFIEAQFPKSKEKLEKAENVLKETEDHYENELKTFKDRWQKKILNFKAQWKIDFMEREVGVIESKLINFESELIDVRVSIKSTRDNLDQLAAEIKKHPQFLTVAKAITDDALWERIGKDTLSTIPEDLTKQKLRSEQLNPVYENLSQRLADTRIKLETLIPKEHYLENEIRIKKGEVDSLRRLIYDKTFELAQLERERDAKQHIFKRKRDLELERANREVATYKNTYANLAQKSESAELAKVEESEDMKIAARAVEPGHKIGPNRKRNVIAAGVVALMAAIVLAFFLEYIATKMPDPLSQRAAGKKA